MQVLDPAKIYRHDIRVTVNGLAGVGTVVAPKAAKYLIKGETVGKLDLLTITTCHRDVSWSPGGTKFEYEFSPSESLEATGACPMYIGGYDRKGQHSWAMIDFEDDSAKLPGLLKCNGYGQTFKGVSICQSRQSLTQFIEFESPVRISPDPKCPMPASVNDGRRFEFPLVRGVCTYAFMESGGARRVHRLTTIGYESVLLREE